MNISTVLKFPGKHQTSFIFFTFSVFSMSVIVAPAQPRRAPLSSCREVSGPEALLILQCRGAALTGAWQQLPGPLK